MAYSRKIIRVFIASPGDLGSERHIARDVATEINQLLGDTFGAQIEMVGWEETIGTMGRPQELINRDLIRCELFIGIIWKRWGTPPDIAGRYTSGFEEEFNLAKELYSKNKKPQLSMFFKSVSDDLLRDPGPDLQKVIGFKNELIEKKEILFMSFLDEKEFERKLRKTLISYMEGLRQLELLSQEDNASQSPSDGLIETKPLKLEVSKYFENETIDFLKETINSIEFNGVGKLLSHQIAFFRLLGLALKKGDNSETFLGAHDANLIYLHSDNYSIGPNEKGGLILSGIDNYSDHNVPIWKWLDLDKNEDTLLAYSIISKGKNRANSINILLALNRPLSSTFDRKVVFEQWFKDDSTKSVKVSALKYLSNHGINDDLGLIRDEISKHDTSTNDIAIEAMIGIVSRESVFDAFDIVLQYQPANVNDNLVSFFRENSAHLTFDQLKGAVISDCEVVRTLAFDILQQEYKIDGDLIDEIFKSEFIDVKSKLLIYMAKDDYINAKTLAKTWLVYKDNKGLIVNESYDRFLNETMHYESVEHIKKRLESELRFDGFPLLALAKKGLDVYTNTVRETISDDCEKQYMSILEKYSGNDSESAIATFSQIEGGIKQRICILYADWIASKLDKKELELMRTFLRSEHAMLTNNLITYFSRFGDWSDVLELVKFDKSNKWSLIGGKSSISLIKSLLCNSIVKLSSGKVSELLMLNIDANLKKVIIARLTKASINKLSTDEIIRLMNDGNSSIREAICLKYINCAPKERIVHIQSEILSKETYFYNVVHWLDMGVSLKKEWSINASNRLLGLL